MAVLYQVWVPAVAVAHLIGLSLLAYSLEKVSGVVSKTASRISRVFGAGKQTAPPEAVCPPNTPQDVEAGQGAPCTPTKAIAGLQQHTGEGSPEDAGTSAGLGKIPPATLVWHEVTCDILDRASLKSKRVLSEASGSAQPGEVVGLLGPSGAGKSTLLDILAKRKTCGRITGTVQCNGSSLGADFKRRSAYVPQEDVFVPTLCALETVQFAAQLRLPGAATPGYCSTRVKQVMKVMGLWRSRNTQVGGALPGGILVRGLSGGEKRRLSIACALVSTPSILFLDEPTTGLDSYAALNVMAHMNALAAMGQTIILSVHQPRAAIFEALHKVGILSEGRSMYFGAPSLVVNWFDKHLGYSYSPTTHGSVSDWVIDLVSVGFAKGAPADPGMPAAPVQVTMKSIEDVNHAADIFACMDANSVEATSNKLLVQDLPQEGGGQADQVRHDKQMGHYAASWTRQFAVLAKRHLLGQLRNPTDSSSRLLMSCYVGLLAGLVFFNLPQDGAHAQEHLALLFFVLLLYQLLPFCYMSFFVADRRFYAADVANGLYRPSAYYAATIVSSAPFIVLNTVIGSLAAYGLGGLNAKFTAVLLNVLLVALQSLVATQFQIACVLATPNQDLAFVFATAYVACSILWSGFYIRVADMKVSVMRGLSWVSYTKYAMMGVARVELQDRVYDTSACQAAGNTRPSQELPGGSSAACMPSGEAVLKYWGYDLGIGAIFAVLIAFYLVCHLVSYLSLRRMRERR